jgi:parvulin-like peptidyl-prolyl isomerase
MSARSSRRPRWRPIALATTATAAVAAVVWWTRGPSQEAAARPAPPAAPAAAAPPPPAVPSDYHQRVVAFLDQEGKDVVTRADLGEYLIPRCGPDKLDLLIKKRVLDDACRARGIVVTALEVEAAIAEEMQGLNVNRERFVKDVLRGYRKNLTEWREDVVRVRLQLDRLIRDGVGCTPEEVRQAFEARYGEKVECRVIFWETKDEGKARAEWTALRDSEEAFDERAHNQPERWKEYSATGGKIKPFGRYTLSNATLEEAAFRLRPGQISEPVKTPEGIVLIKCDRRLPADTTASFEAKRDALAREVLDKKVAAKIKTEMPALLADARVRNLVREPGRSKMLVGPDAKVLAYIHDSEPVTREELGEFLVQRYGGERLEMLANKRLIERACKDRNIAVSDAEIDAELANRLKRAQVDSVETFITQVLNREGKNLYEYREDAIRPELQLARLGAAAVQVTPEALQQAFEAHYGEKVKCRLIIWPKEEERFALMEYARLRDSEAEFDRKARQQASGVLASKAGHVDPVARHTVGDDDLEAELFKLQPGEVSRLVNTPQGVVMAKVDGRVPAVAGVTLEQKRPELEAEVRRKLTEAEAPRVFARLKEQAAPRLLLRDPNRADDLAASVKADLAHPRQAGRGSAVQPVKAQ